uniref:Uncharacterized protein n=2 Tax=Aegilops tauschii subsp. strangulata TaxID=200361 RepID=A0A452YNK0_AEGTS
NAIVPPPPRRVSTALLPHHLRLEEGVRRRLTLSSATDAGDAPPLPPTPLRASDSPATEDPILLGVSDDRIPRASSRSRGPARSTPSPRSSSTRDPITPDRHSSFVFMFVFDSHIQLVCSGRYIWLLAGEDLLCLLIFSALGRLVA